MSDAQDEEDGQKEPPLYEDEQLKIDYLVGPKGERITDEHEIHVAQQNNWTHPTGYILQRHVLQDLATRPNRDLSPLERMHSGISLDLRQNGLTLESVGLAICKAYMEEQRRYEALDKAK